VTALRALVGRWTRGDVPRTVAANTSARLLAIAGLTAATVVVARVGGPADVGAYALLRMLPGLVGVLCVAGLPGALAYFLAEPRRDAPRLWPTLFAILAVGAGVGTVAWVGLAPLLQRLFFPHDSSLMVAAAGATVASQLLITVGKTSLQGLQDRRGGDIVIAAEELAFLPCYLIPLALGIGGTAAIIIGLGLADLVVAAEAWRRVAGRLGWQHFGLHRQPTGWLGRPDRRLAKDVVTYGTRGQVGGLITLLNLRLDFAILGAMAGPAVLGTYAVASKYAELLRLPGTALTWVCYPLLAGASVAEAGQRARRLLRPALVVVPLAAVPLLLLTGPVMRLLYGARFDPAIAPAQVLLLGMLLGGAAGVASGFLYARGRPGLNPVAMGGGLVLTVVLDVLLIPHFGAMGAAVASTAAYLLADGLLVVLLVTGSRPDRTPAAAGSLDTAGATPTNPAEVS
jgi:O-antigen/teichoic acid export membrane protein